jgi:predicted enzyme related to lactoylglutathione lyase
MASLNVAPVLPHAMASFIDLSQIDDKDKKITQKTGHILATGSNKPYRCKSRMASEPRHQG